MNDLSGLGQEDKVARVVVLGRKGVGKTGIFDTLLFFGHWRTFSYNLLRLPSCVRTLYNYNWYNFIEIRFDLDIFFLSLFPLTQSFSLFFNSHNFVFILSLLISSQNIYPKKV